MITSEDKFAESGKLTQEAMAVLGNLDATAEEKANAGEKFEASNGESAREVFDALKDARFKVGDIEKKKSVSRPSPPQM